MLRPPFPRHAKQQCQDDFILKNLAVLTQMLGNLFEVAAQVGHLPTESMSSMAPRWISKNPNFGRQEETPSATLALTNTSKEDQDLENCTKLAALAGIRLPAVGDTIALRQRRYSFTRQLI